jgi:hypothetical protein
MKTPYQRKSQTEKRYKYTLYAQTSIEAWAKPYDDKFFKNVQTRLGKQFEFSPIFKNPIADTWVELTGYRRKDYIIAEKQTGTMHTPGLTVWHHAWDVNNNGKYRMQLVDFDLHKKTYPHAGGCRLWQNNQHKVKRYASSYRLTKRYTDYQIDYEIDGPQHDYYQRGYMSKRIMQLTKAKGLKLVGMDAYGNLFYETHNRQVYIYDHEYDTLVSLGKMGI